MCYIVCIECMTYMVPIPTRRPVDQLVKRKPPPPPKASYAKAVASPPVASKTAALRKSCIKQGTKATKVVLRFPSLHGAPSTSQLWGTLAEFQPAPNLIESTLRGDYVFTFDHVLTSNDHGRLVAQLKKVYSVDIQVLNRGTTSLLKFSLVPTHHPDGSIVTPEWLYKTITRHPK